MRSRTSSDRAVPLPALASSSDQTPIAQLGVPSATAKASAAVNWIRLRTSNDQTRSASGNPQTVPLVATPITAALATTATDTTTAPICQRLPTRGPANDEARAPTRMTKVTNIAVWRNHARGSLRMCGLRNWAEPRGPTTDRRVAIKTPTRASRAMRPIGPVRLAVQEEELDVAFT